MKVYKAVMYILSLEWLLKLIIAMMCARNHDHFVVQELTDGTRRVGCYRCKKTFAMHDDLKAFDAWDYSYARLYTDYGIVLKEPCFDRKMNERHRRIESMVKVFTERKVRL